MNYYDPRYMLLQEEKLKSIIQKQQSVVAIAQELSVSRQSIHKWLQRYKRFGVDGLLIQRKKRHAPAHNRTAPEIEQLVINRAKHYFNDGVLTLADRIQSEYNLSLNPSTLYRILKRNDVRYTDRYTRTKKRWKKQLFAHTTPGKELQMDTKYPYGYKQGKVIYTIIDDASRWVFAWSYETANAQNTVDFLQKFSKDLLFISRRLEQIKGESLLLTM